MGLQVFQALNCSGEVVYLVLNGLVLCFAFKDGSLRDSHVLLVDTDNIIERGKCVDFCKIVRGDFLHLSTLSAKYALRLTTFQGHFAQSVQFTETRHY